MLKAETGIAITWFTLVGVLLGWGIAHGIVSSECDKLGGFYVNDTVYECRQKKEQTL